MGRKPKFTQAEIDHMKDLFTRKEKPLSAVQIGRLFNCTNTTVLRAVEGKLKARKDPDENPLREASHQAIKKLGVILKPLLKQKR